MRFKAIMAILGILFLAGCGVTPDYYVIQVIGTPGAEAAITVTADGVQKYSGTTPLPFSMQIMGDDAAKKLRVQASIPEGQLKCEIDSVTGMDDSDVAEEFGEKVASGRVEAVCLA